MRPRGSAVLLRFAVLSLGLVVSELSFAPDLEVPLLLESLSLLQLRAGRVGSSINGLSAEVVAREALDVAVGEFTSEANRGTTVDAVDALNADGLAELLGRLAERADAEVAGEVDGTLARVADRLVRRAAAANNAALVIDALRLSARGPDAANAEEEKEKAEEQHQKGKQDGDESAAAFNVTEVDHQLDVVRQMRREAEEAETAGTTGNSSDGDRLAFASAAKGLVEEQAGGEVLAEFKLQASETASQLSRAAAATAGASRALDGMFGNATSVESAELQHLGFGLDELSGLLESQQAASRMAAHGVRELRCSFARLLAPQTLEQQAECNTGVGNQSDSSLRAAVAEHAYGAPAPKHPKEDVLRFVHIISLMPGMDEEQAAVLESMVEAKKRAESGGMGVEVELLAVQMVGEKEQELPSGFHVAPPLSNNTNAAFGCQRSLPFARDLLLTLESHSPDADFYVMTNSDICVTPHFYLDLANANRQDGLTGLNVLKVIIPAQCDGEPLSEDRSKALHYAETLPQTHPGSDCFMWEARKTRDIIEQVGEVFFGWPPLGSALHNAIRQVSSKFQVVRGQHWTYHIGGEGERGRGSTLHIPSVVTEYQAEVEKAYPGCKFSKDKNEKAKRARGEGDGDDEESDDCNYVSLNTQWSDLYKHCIESDAGCMDADEREAS